MNSDCFLWPSALNLDPVVLFVCFRWPLADREPSTTVIIPEASNEAFMKPAGPSKHMNFPALFQPFMKEPAPALGPANTLRQGNIKAFPDRGRQKYKEQNTSYFLAWILLCSCSGPNSIQTDNYYFIWSLK